MRCRPVRNRRRSKIRYDPETGRPWTDKNNPDPARRGRPLVGVPVLYGLVPDGPGRWSGRLYNVDNGNSYAGRLLELGPTTIRVEGCAIGICGGQNMTPNSSRLFDRVDHIIRSEEKQCIIWVRPLQQLRQLGDVGCDAT